MAPEIIARTGHGKAVDWWSLGCLTFEMIVGLPPFMVQGRDKDRLFRQISEVDIKWPTGKNEVPAKAKKFILDLLVVNADERLGGKAGSAELKAHEWFIGIDFVKLATKEYRPPMKPSIKSVTDTKFFESQFVNQIPEDSYINCPMGTWYVDWSYNPNAESTEE